MQRVSVREQVRALKQRRDRLLNRACTRRERETLMEEVRTINRTIKALEDRLRL